MGRPSSFTNKTRPFRCPSMAAQSPSYRGYLHSPRPEGRCLFNTAHGEMALVCQRAFAGGGAHGAAPAGIVPPVAGKLLEQVDAEIGYDDGGKACAGTLGS